MLSQEPSCSVTSAPPHSTNQADCRRECHAGILTTSSLTAGIDIFHCVCSHSDRTSLLVLSSDSSGTKFTDITSPILGGGDHRGKTSMQVSTSVMDYDLRPSKTDHAQVLEAIRLSLKPYENSDSMSCQSGGSVPTSVYDRGDSASNHSSSSSTGRKRGSASRSNSEELYERPRSFGQSVDIMSPGLRWAFSSQSASSPVDLASAGAQFPARSSGLGPSPGEPSSQVPYPIQRPIVMPNEHDFSYRKDSDIWSFLPGHGFPGSPAPPVGVPPAGHTHQSRVYRVSDTPSNQRPPIQADINGVVFRRPTIQRDVSKRVSAEVLYRGVPMDQLTPTSNHPHGYVLPYRRSIEVDHPTQTYADRRPPLPPTNVTIICNGSPAHVHSQHATFCDSMYHVIQPSPLRDLGQRYSYIESPSAHTLADTSQAHQPYHYPFADPSVACIPTSIFSGSNRCVPQPSRILPSRDRPPVTNIGATSRTMFKSRSGTAAGCSPSDGNRQAVPQLDQDSPCEAALVAVEGSDNGSVCSSNRNSLYADDGDSGVFSSKRTSTYSGSEESAEGQSGAPEEVERCVSPMSLESDCANDYDTVVIHMNGGTEPAGGCRPKKIPRESFNPRVKQYSPQAYKFFMEQHIENVLRQSQLRLLRRRRLELEMETFQVREEERDEIRRLLCQKESQYLRQSRAKMDKSVFETIKCLGVGAFGEVALVRKRGTDMLYAMKTLRKSDVLKRNQVAHVKAERDILAEADNEWVVKLYFSFQDEKNLYFVMDYIPGGDLMGLLIKFGIFQEPVARFYIAELVLAIDSVHKMGFIHRDIKPDNILIDRNGHIKLTDFGLCTGFRWTHDSKYYHTDDGHVRQPSMEPDGGWESLLGNAASSCGGGEVDDLVKQFSQLKPLERRAAHQQLRRKAHSLVGTPNYIAPEVLLRKGYTKLCDWWSVGVILYEMLVGRPPFAASNPTETQLKIVNWKQNLRFPSKPELSMEASNMILNLCSDAESRLGRNDVSEIKNHPFFKLIDWSQDMRQLRAPYVPYIGFPTDTSNFDDAEPVRDTSEQVDTLPSLEKSQHAFYEFTFRRFFDDFGSSGCRDTMSDGKDTDCRTSGSDTTLDNIDEDSSQQPVYV